jgi:hypothetical protein
MHWEKNEASHIKDCTPLSTFILFFFESTQLLMVEINRYYHQYARQRTHPSAWCDSTEKNLLLPIIVQMVDDQRDTLKDYWSKVQQLLQSFMKKHWQETNSFIYWDFHTSVATQVSLIKLTKIMTDYR